MTCGDVFDLIINSCFDVHVAPALQSCLSVTMFAQMNTHDWVVPGFKAASLQICLTGAKKQLWGAWKVPKLWPSPVSHLPAGAIKVRQSSALASLYLWRRAAPRWLPSPTPAAALSSRRLSLTCQFFHQRLPASYPLAAASVKAGREPSKWKWWPLCPSSMFLAVVRDGTQDWCWLTAASHRRFLFAGAGVQHPTGLQGILIFDSWEVERIAKRHVTWCFVADD